MYEAKHNKWLADMLEIEAMTERNKILDFIRRQAQQPSFNLDDTIDAVIQGRHWSALS